jgi:hypothetical protein
MRFPDLFIIPEIAQPDGILACPSRCPAASGWPDDVPLCISSSKKEPKIDKKGVHQMTQKAVNQPKLAADSRIVK